MKRILSIVLTLVIILGLCSCAGGTTKKSNTDSDTKLVNVGKGNFRVGYGKVSILADESVPIGGLANTERRMSNGYLDPVYAIAVAYADKDGNVAVSLVLDLTGANAVVTDPIATSVASATGLQSENLMIYCTHTHAGPDTANTKLACILRYNRSLVKWATEAVTMAIKDLKDAKAYIGSVQTSGLNFVRHYLCKDGTYAGDNFGSYSSGIVCHESEADHEIQLIRFKREGGKDIVLSNFQVHPTMNCGDDELNLSADLVGAYRDNIEEALDCNCIYFQGACGNINPRSSITSETPTADYRLYGKQLADFAVSGIDSLKECKVDKIKIESSTFEGKVDHTQDKKLALANLVVETWTSSGYDNTKTTNLANSFGMNSIYTARGIIRRAGMGATLNLGIRSISFGDIAFVCAPYEMFDTNGMYIKDNSPFEMTFITGYYQKTSGYIPSALNYQNGGYEADLTSFVAGTGEELADKFLSMLKSLKR